MQKNSELSQRAHKVLEVLQTRYPVAKTQLQFTTPWELLAATQLSAQCTDDRVNLVTPQFFKLWPKPEILLGASQEEVEEVIRSTGFFHNKAKNLLACANKIVNEFSGEIPKNMKDMLQLPGVARKTASVVLWGAYGINEGIAVDTHVKRISYRLGLTEHTEPVKIEQDLMPLFPQTEWGNVNTRMVLFGRDVCKAKKQDCANCACAAFCPKLEPPRQTSPKIKGAKHEHEPIARSK